MIEKTVWINYVEQYVSDVGNWKDKGQQYHAKRIQYHGKMNISEAFNLLYRDISS